MPVLDDPTVQVIAGDAADSGVGNERLRATPRPRANALAEGETGLLLLEDNQDAFAARALSARSALKTLDLMYYMWRDDHTGRLLTQEVLNAANRGIKVRMLLDDINPSNNDATYLALDSHPNISLRLFNPSWSRRSRLLRGLEMAWRVVAMTRRMHNKAWIADADIAIIGGRNIGDAYFDAADTNFRDLDVLLTGAGVAQTAAIFETFWNSRLSKPIQVLNPTPGFDRTKFGQALRQRLQADAARAHLDRIKDKVSIADFMAESGGPVHRTDTARVISDPPGKALGRHRRNWLMKTLLPVIQEAKVKLEIISPYFIPGPKGTRILASMVSGGTEVAVLTNSLAATDVAAVHGAYALYRRRLLKSGVELYELQPFGHHQKVSVFGSKGASLHTKAFTVDDRAGFIGSFNFDPRSVSLNTEMGVLFEHDELVAELRKRFLLETSPQTSYRLSLRRKRLRWEGEDDGEVRTYTRDPEASLFRRLTAAIVQLLPLESQL